MVVDQPREHAGEIDLGHVAVKADLGIDGQPRAVGLEHLQHAQRWLQRLLFIGDEHPVADQQTDQRCLEDRAETARRRRLQQSPGEPDQFHHPFDVTLGADKAVAIDQKAAAQLDRVILITHLAVTPVRPSAAVTQRPRMPAVKRGVHVMRAQPPVQVRQPRVGIVHLDDIRITAVKDPHQRAQHLLFTPAQLLPVDEGHAQWNIRRSLFAQSLGRRRRTDFTRGDHMKLQPGQLREGIVLQRKDLGAPHLHPSAGCEVPLIEEHLFRRDIGIVEGDAVSGGTLQFTDEAFEEVEPRDRDCENFLEGIEIRLSFDRVKGDAPAAQKRRRLRIGIDERVEVKLAVKVFTAGGFHP